MKLILIRPWGSQMRCMWGLVIFVLGALLSAPALGAVVEPIQGQVSINSGGGFQQIPFAVEANVGDVVMAAPNGRARIVYADGCLVPVEPGQVVAIEPESPCRREFAWNEWYIVGGVGIAAAVGVGIYFVVKKDDDPTSP
jgi:hypothetical protein